MTLASVMSLHLPKKHLLNTSTRRGCVLGYCETFYSKVHVKFFFHNLRIEPRIDLDYTRSWADNSTEYLPKIDAQLLIQENIVKDQIRPLSFP